MKKTINGVQIIFSDLDYRMITDNQGDIRIVYNADAVTSALINIMSTNKGERVMLPEFGANLRGLLFNNFGENFQRMVATQVKNQIERWDNRITIVNMQFIQDPPTASMYVYLSFMVKGIDQLQQTTVKV